jgi:hypothetical protein
MRDPHPRRRAPDYTDAALISGLVNLVWIFVALWAAFGFWSVLLAGLTLNRAITWLERRPR